MLFRALSNRASTCFALPGHVPGRKAPAPPMRSANATTKDVLQRRTLPRQRGVSHGQDNHPHHRRACGVAATNLRVLRAASDSSLPVSVLVFCILALIGPCDGPPFVSISFRLVPSRPGQHGEPPIMNMCFGPDRLCFSLE